MDALSLILDDIRLRGARFQHVRLAAPWKLWLSTPGLASFHICRQGRACLLRSDCDPLQLEPGDLVILPLGTEHRLQDCPDSPAREHDLSRDLESGQVEVLHLDGGGEITELLSGHFRFDIDLARPLMNALPPVIHLRGDNGVPPAWLHIGLQFLFNEQASVQLGQQAVINRMADVLFIECLRYYMDTLQAGSESWLLAMRDDALSSVLVAMHSRPEYDWTAPRLAEIACMSRSAFVERFKSFMGAPPLTYLREHRMRLAAWQLRHTRQPVCRIADQLGYGSDTAFGQAFKRSHGCTPSQYRQRG